MIFKFWGYVRIYFWDGVFKILKTVDEYLFKKNIVLYFYPWSVKLRSNL